MWGFFITILKGELLAHAAADFANKMLKFPEITFLSEFSEVRSTTFKSWESQVSFYAGVNLIFSLIDVFEELGSNDKDVDKVPFNPKKIHLLILPVVDWYVLNFQF